VVAFANSLDIFNRFVFGAGDILCNKNEKICILCLLNFMYFLALSCLVNPHGNAGCEKTLMMLTYYAGIYSSSYGRTLIQPTLVYYSIVVCLRIINMPVVSNT